MLNFLYYTAVVLIWGSTWLAITWQLGEVPPVISVCARFILASALLLGFCRLTGRPLRYRLIDHLWMALQGTFLFALNYWLFYLAELTLTSGLVAVIFALMVPMNLINARLFLGTPLQPSVLLGGAIGLGGILLVFWPEVRALQLDGPVAQGLVLSFAATYLASLGNIISARNQKAGLPVMQVNAYGMGYGALLMLIVSRLQGHPFILDWSWSYLGALIYLAIFGSIIAFGCYLSLIGRIGAGKAAYSTLLFPLVALLLSTWFENYHWSHTALLGVTMILGGNLLVLRRPQRSSPAKTESRLTSSASLRQE